MSWVLLWCMLRRGWWYSSMYCTQSVVVLLLVRTSRLCRRSRFSLCRPPLYKREHHPHWRSRWAGTPPPCRRCLLLPCHCARPPCRHGRAGGGHVASRPPSSRAPPLTVADALSPAVAVARASTTVSSGNPIALKPYGPTLVQLASRSPHSRPTHSDSYTSRAGAAQPRTTSLSIK